MATVYFIYETGIEPVKLESDSADMLVGVGTQMRRDGDRLLGIATEDCKWVWSGHLKREDGPILDKMVATARMLF